MISIELLPPGIGEEEAIMLLSLLSALSTVFFVWYTLIARDNLAERVKMLTAEREHLRAAYLAPVQRNRLEAQVGFMRSFLDRLKLLRSNEANKSLVKLMQAGFRGRDAIVFYLFCRFLCPFVFGAVGMVLISWLHVVKVPEPLRLPATIFLVLLGAAAPGLYLKNMATKRRQAMQKGLPDAIDLMVICAEAGLSLDATLTRVSNEMSRSCPPLADEFGLTSVELGFLPERRKALDNLNLRTDMPSIRGLVNTLQQSEKYGTPLAQSLRVLSSEFRDQRMMKAEEKAARLPAVMTVPMIIFIMPALFIVLIGPAILRTIDALRAM